MAIKPEEKIEILQYKLYFEELEIVESLFQKGQADLLAHVTNFRENLSEDVDGQRENLRRSLLISDGSWSFLWDRPLTICIMITILMIISWQIYNSYKSFKN